MSEICLSSHHVSAALVKIRIWGAFNSRVNHVRIGAHSGFPADRRHEITAATQRLLGDAIALSEDDWHAPTRLPGWSRAHIATHLTRHAQALTALVREITTTHPSSFPWTIEHADEDLNLGAFSGAIALQEALDTSSADLMAAFDEMDDAGWAVPLTTGSGPLPASALVLDRLNEVIIHHVDLDLGFDFTDVDPTVVRSLLDWNLERRPGLSKVLQNLLNDGHTAEAILGWLTGRYAPVTVGTTHGLEFSGPW